MPSPKPAPVGAPVLLEVSGLTADGLGPVDLTVRAGEIVGIAGLMGSGRSRLIHTVAGAQPATGGSMLLNGKRYTPSGPGDGAAAGIALIPEDRKEQSLVTFAPIRANVTVSVLKRISNRGLLGPKRERAEAKKITKNVNVRMQSVEQPIGSLSGGNQQRAIFGRAFAVEPRLLLLDEPTRGVDVGAKAEIYQLIDRAAEQGAGVVVASSELEELLWICHRIAVMNHGRVVEVFDRADATKERIMTAAAGDASVHRAAAQKRSRTMTAPSTLTPAPQGAAPPRETPVAARLLRKLAESPEAGVILACVLVFTGIALDAPTYTATGNLQVMGRDLAQVGILAIGESLVILTGGIDLSVGALAGLVGHPGRLVQRQPGHARAAGRSSSRWASARRSAGGTARWSPG